MEGQTRVLGSATNTPSAANLLRRSAMSTLPRSSGVYKILCVPTGKVYVGSSINVAYRWQVHRAALRHNRHFNPYLQHAWNKYGEAAFTIEVVEIVPVEKLREREQFWLMSLKAHHKQHGFNDQYTAQGQQHSDETKARIALAKRGRKASPETRAKMSASRTGHIVSPETREKIAAAQRGRKLSAEQVAGMSARARGKSPSIETRAKLGLACAKTYVVTAPDGISAVVSNLTAFCKAHGMDPRRMHEVAAGRNKSFKGWTCHHANEADDE
jgi:group I intron endonuclease